nr:hypothetical protein [Eubacterium ramulus]
MKQDLHRYNLEIVVHILLDLYEDLTDMVHPELDGVELFAHY